MNLRLCIALLVLLLHAASVSAQALWPAQPVRIVVGFVAGGSTDQVARIVADGLAKRTQQTFVVENRPGATGNIAAGQVARAPGDGHTLLLSAVGLATTAAFNPSILQAHPTRDLSPIALLAYTPNVLLASPTSGFATVADVMAFGRRQPGALSFGHSGYGGGLHLSGEVFALRSGVNMTQVPYKGVAPMMGDLLANHIPIAWNNLSTALPQVRSGSVRALAIAAAARAPEIPDTPTFAELGFADMQFGAWFGLSGPTNLAPDLTQTIAAQVSAVLDDPAVQQQIRALGLEALNSTSPAAFAAYVDADIARWRAIVTQANISPGN